MGFQILPAGEKVAVCRGDVVVCIPVFGGFDVFAQCLSSLLTHTAAEHARILICDDATTDPAFARYAQEAVEEGGWPHDVNYLRREDNVGFPENMNGGFAVCAPADVVILNSDCIVTEGWLPAMRAAALSDSRVATATALTNAGTIVSVPHRNQSLPSLSQDLTPDRVGDAIRAASSRLRPDLPTCIGHCVYIRREALELVGDFDLAFSPGYGEEVDFSERCIVHGLRHVLADDVFVYHRHAGSFGNEDRVVRLREEHEQIVRSRYPFYEPWVAEVAGDTFSPLARTLLTARSAMLGLSVTIDGRCLTQFMTGTALATIELIAALSVHTDLLLRVLVPPDLGDYAASLLQGREIEILTTDQVAAGTGRTDVAHRPYQVSSARDLETLEAIGEKVVISHLDSIALRNPSYFDTYRGWRAYRDLVRGSLAGADQVVFISRHGAWDARAQGLTAEERINVIPIGTDHMLPDLYPEAAPPADAGRLHDRPFLLCLGTDFMHKNRPFALKLLHALLEQELFDGSLVFAGPRVRDGSSAGLESRYLSTHPKLGERVIDLAAVEEPEKQWLLAHASAVVYPTTFEGFGLVPYEAARVGTPTLFAWNTALVDYLPESLALLVPWDEDESARRVAPVLVSGQAREQQVAGVRMAGARLTASEGARRHAEVYARARDGASPHAAQLARDLLRIQAERDEFESELGAIYADRIRAGFTPRYGIVPEEIQRSALAIAMRPPLRSGAVAFYRAANGAKRSLSRKTK